MKRKLEEIVRNLKREIEFYSILPALLLTKAVTEVELLWEKEV